MLRYGSHYHYQSVVLSNALNSFMGPKTINVLATYFNEVIDYKNYHRSYYYHGLYISRISKKTQTVFSRTQEHS